MYPLPRILISAALLLGVVYGVLALVLLLPKHQGLLVAVYGLPFVVPAIAIAFFAHGEPNDQTEVHLPPVSTKHPRKSTTYHQSSSTRSTTSQSWSPTRVPCSESTAGASRCTAPTSVTQAAVRS